MCRYLTKNAPVHFHISGSSNVHVNPWIFANVHGPLCHHWMFDHFHLVLFGPRVWRVRRDMVGCHLRVFNLMFLVQWHTHIHLTMSNHSIHSVLHRFIRGVDRGQLGSAQSFRPAPQAQLRTKTQALASPRSPQERLGSRDGDDAFCFPGV